MAVKICGIYKITSPSGKIYIGQSVDILNRVKSYRTANCKYQRLLYNSIKKYGWDNHNFEIVCITDESQLDSLEVYYINLYNSFDSNNGLNLSHGGKAFRKHSMESRKKMSETRKGRTLSEERKEKLRGKRGKQKNKRTLEHRQKLSKPKTEETKNKIRQAHLGKKLSEETKLKISNSKKNLSEEVKNKWRVPWSQARRDAQKKVKTNKNGKK